MRMRSRVGNSGQNQLSRWRILRIFLCLLMVPLPIPVALMAHGDTDLYTASIRYAPGTAARAGRQATLDIVVRNIRAHEADDWISAVVVDFSQTGMIPLDPGPLPLDWQGRVEQGTVITYLAGHGVSAVHEGEVVQLTPRVRNPAQPKLVALPRIIAIPLASMADFQGPALRAIDRVPHVELRPTGRLRLMR